MNLLEALHNFTQHLLNRSPQDKIGEAIDLLEGALTATGHAAAAAAVDKAITSVEVIDSLAQAVTAKTPPAPTPTPVPAPAPVPSAAAAVISAAAASLKP